MYSTTSFIGCLCVVASLGLLCGAITAEESATLLKRARHDRETGDLDKALETYSEAILGSYASSIEARFEFASLLEDHAPHKHELSWKLYHEAANLGSSDAQHRLAVAYSSGMFVHPIPIDEGLGILYDTFSAASSHPKANAALGYRYFHGLSVPANCELALEHFEIAANHVAAVVEQRGFTVYAERSRLSLKKGPKDINEEVVEYYSQLAHAGEVVAQISLGNLYLTGSKLIEQDPQVAVGYYEMAARAGDAAGAGQVGYMYARGIGVEVDADKALQYLNFAQKHNDVQAFLGLGYYHWKGVGGQQNMTAAVQFMAKAAAEPHNHPTALYFLGEIHSGQGRHVVGVPEDVNGWNRIEIGAAQAYLYYSRAAQRNHVLALHRLGQLTARGLGTPRACKAAVAAFRSVIEKADWGFDLTTASRLHQDGQVRQALTRYLSMSHLGFNIAQSNAGFILSREYCPGTNSTACEARALRLYRLSALQDDAEAHLKVGDFYYYGRGGLTPDRHEAVLHYESAAELKNPHAMFNLGVMFESGDGVIQDFHLAKRYFDQAGDYDPHSRASRGLAVWMLQMHKMLHSLVGPARAERWIGQIMHAFAAVYDQLVYMFAAPMASAMGTAPVIPTSGGVYTQTRPQGTLGTFWDSLAETFDGAINGPTEEWRQTRKAGQETGYFMWNYLWNAIAWDTCAALVLSIIFFAVARIRAQRNNNR